MKKNSILFLLIALLILGVNAFAILQTESNSRRQCNQSFYEPIIVLNPIDTLDCSNYDFDNYEWLPYPIEAEVHNANEIQWVTSGDGTFSDPTIANPTYLIGKNDLLNNSVILQITATDYTTTISAELNLVIPLQVIQIDIDGFYGLSSYVDKSDTSVPDVMTPVVQNLVIMLNELGQYYWPPANANQIGNWSAVGYRAKFVNPSACLPIFGNPVADKTYMIDGSLNYLPVLTDYPVNIVELLGDNIDKVLVINNWKDSLNWTPTNPGFDFLQPGLAYLVIKKAEAASFMLEFPPYSWELPVNVPSQKPLEATVFPNPSDGVFYVKHTGNEQEVRFEVFNMQGLTILSGIAIYKFNIDLTDYPNGMYYLKISSGDKQSLTKLILHE